MEKAKVKIHEQILDMQCRSMKNNLIFTGLMENRGEDCEDKLRSFIYNELNIEKFIEFGNIHRFGKRHEDGRPRPIVARFIYYNDLVMVKSSGRFLKDTPYGINEQFPAEIEERRRRLYPIMKEEKRKRSKVVLVRDKLYVNDELIVANVSTSVEPRPSTTRPKKRPRVNSTPERESY